MNKLIWTLRQLLPLKYQTFYTEKGKKHFTTWNMFFGKCFNVIDVEIR